MQVPSCPSCSHIAETHPVVPRPKPSIQETRILGFYNMARKKKKKRVKVAKPKSGALGVGGADNTGASLEELEKTRQLKQDKIDAQLLHKKQKRRFEKAKLEKIEMYRQNFNGTHVICVVELGKHNVDHVERLRSWQNVYYRCTGFQLSLIHI